ncbi:MAG: ATP-binding protein [Bacteroidetes bacterium]|nr:ATP-binding protein [Bacteroidota bacterium]
MSRFPRSITTTVRSSTDHLREVRHFVEAAARQFGFVDEDVSNIVLAVDEACTNIIKHAYGGSSTGEIRVTVIREGTSFEVQIHDQGRPFDPESIHPPNLKQHLSEYRRGGLGVYLMRRLMDQVEFSIHPGRPNEVRLVKYLGSPSAHTGT